MKKFYLFVISSMIGALSVPVDAYIYHAVVMRKWYAELNRYHYFIGLGDFHYKQHPANRQHLDELHQLLAGSSKDSLKVLTEDLSVANDIGRRGAQGFSINSRGGLLGGLTDICRGYGIHTQNLEYRYARVCALGPLLNNMSHDPYSLDSMRKLSVRDLSDEIYTELDRIALFDDGPQLQSWYASCVREVEKKMVSFNWPSYQRASVAEYVSRNKKPLGPFLQNLLTFDASLLDIKIVHEIVQHADVERTCAIAGGSHIDRASKALQKIGYTSVWHTQSGCGVVSAIDAGPDSYKIDHAIKPAPISLHLLKKFF